MINKLNFNRLIVLKGSTAQIVSRPETLVLPFEELVYLAKKGRLLKFLFRFKIVLLKIQKLETLTSPFLTISMLKMISCRHAIIEDDKGRSATISWVLIFKKMIDFGREWIDSKAFQTSTAKYVDSCLKNPFRKFIAKPRSNGQPVYLRTDLTCGLQAGGSIGHIAGVLNNINIFSKPPIFLTSENIPTIDDSIETHIVLPDNRFPSFPESKYLAYSQSIVIKAKQILHQRNISFIYQRYSLNNFAGYKLSQYYKVPFVLEYNGSEIWVGKNWGKSVKNECLSNAIELLNLRHADLIVVVSEALKEEITRRKISPRKIIVNPNGVDTEKYSPKIDGSGVIDEWGLNDKIVIGFIGTFGRWHGAEILVEAFGALLNKYPVYKNNVSLFLIGDGQMMPIVRERAKKWNIQSNVIFTGVVPQECGAIYMAACDILVSPHVPNPDGTAFFGSPTKIFEYMAMGKGIIASRLGQIGDVLEHKKTAWMVPPANVNKLMDGLKIMIEKSDLRKQLGTEARSKAVEKHTWAMHTHRIFEALEKLSERD